VIPTSITGTHIPLPSTSTDTENALTRRQTRRQTQLPTIERSKAQLDDVNAGDRDLAGPSWEDRFSKLTDYHRIHGHCNVPQNYSENTQLGAWVRKQRKTYRLHLEEKTSPMTTYRIKALESFGFQWDCYGAAWEDRLSELADYHKIHGHCNVPKRYSENSKLGTWVATQRRNYRLHLEGKKSTMMIALRIQALESLGFEWESPK
jgi:hypothetical protein